MGEPPEASAADRVPDRLAWVAFVVRVWNAPVDVLDDSNADTAPGPGCEPESGQRTPPEPPGAPRPPAPVAPDSAAGPNRGGPVLLALLAAGGLLRFLWLGEWGLWIDEAHTLNDAMATTRASFNYPLNYWATQAVVALRGSVDEATLRLFPAVCGALTLPAAVWAFRPWIGPRRALVTALLLAVSSWHLYWSQSARAYTLAMLLSLVATGWYARGLSARSRPLLVRSLAVALAACFAHPSAALLLPAWVALPWVLERLGFESLQLHLPTWLRRVAAVGVLALALWGALVLYDYWDAKETEVGVGAWFASWKHLVLSTGYYVTPWLGLGAAAGLWTAWRRRPRGGGAPLSKAGDLAAGCVVLGVFACALAMAILVRVSAQYVFVLLPWIAALASAPLGAAAPAGASGTEVTQARVGRTGAWPALYLTALLALGAADLGLYFGPRFGNRPRWREAYAHVLEQRGRDDLVFGMAAVVGQYYLDPGDVNLRSHRDLVRLNSYTAAEPGQWARRGRRTWFVVRDEDLMDWPRDDRAAFQRMLAEECERTLELPVELTPRDLSVAVYVREAFAARRPQGDAPRATPSGD